MKPTTTEHLSIPAKRRSRAEPGDGVDRLLHQAQRATRRAEATLKLARGTAAEKDSVARDLVKHQAIAMIDELKHLCLRMEQSQKELAEALQLTTQIQTALGAYRRPADKEEKR